MTKTLFMIKIDFSNLFVYKFVHYDENRFLQIEAKAFYRGCLCII